MSPNKNYMSERWLTKRYRQDGKNAEAIAKECGVNKTTIMRWLHKYNLIKNPRTW